MRIDQARGIARQWVAANAAAIPGFRVHSCMARERRCRMTPICRIRLIST